MITQQNNTKVKKFGLPNLLLIIGLSALLCGEAYFGYGLYKLSSEQVQIKEDYSLNNSITFGLFSVDQWREKITGVVNGQVQDYSMSAAQKKALQKQVEKQLSGLISKTVAEINKPQKSLAGKLKKFAFNQFVDAKDIQAQVPSFAKTIITKVNSPKSTNRLKDIATSKINQLANETYDSTGLARKAVTTSLAKKYHVNTVDQFDRKVNNRLTAISSLSDQYLYGMIGCVIIALFLWWIMRKQVHMQSTLFIMSLLFAVVLLTVGITASIIEVDARIQSLNFMLMGEKVVFENQVLFYQNKSILGIIQVLIEQSKPDSVVVGALIMLFIIILPLLRLIAKGIHILNRDSDSHQENKIVKYITFETGKWDMADVMVVGVLMTYIGLNGILQSQLTNLNIHNSFLSTTTVNNTSLQPGYYIFVAYVVFDFILSYILKKDEAAKKSEAETEVTSVQA